ncbi:MAG: PQQ-binding-like beta-propeller repeat protein [Planctomycetes bacterium]|nr:PQQ-binding-like beta-propeller repeat protein [Planctomycetota bacterium]
MTEKNIDVDSDGLNEYLSGLHPNEQQRQRALRLIKALGTTDSFFKREDAMAKLLLLPTLPNEELIAASNGSDAEIRWRAKQILKLGRPESDRVLYAALKTIEEKMLTGVTVELIRAIPLCDKAHLRYAARQALKASVRPNVAALLRRELKNENVEVRIAVVAALGKALQERAADDLNNLSDDPEDRVKLAAARALADFGDNNSLEALEKLLASDDKLVQISSALALRELTGKRFGFSAYDKVEKQREAIAKWRAWIAGEGKTAKLSFPLRPFGTGVSYLGGHTLLAFRGLNKVAEYDASGKEVWSFTGAQSAWSAEKLANGNVLIAAHGRQRVIEVDREGSIVWQFQSTHPLNAKQLLNGNYLIAAWGGNRAIEVDPEKNVIWQYKTQSQCGDVHRLENGNTLLAEYRGSVKEVTPDGKVVWQYPATNCYGIQPLANGNVLVTNLTGRVIEVTRDKQIVWEFTEPGAVDAFRLPNGNTLITGNTRFIEVTPDKNIVWTKTGCSYGTARR